MSGFSYVLGWIYERESEDGLNSYWDCDDHYVSNDLDELIEKTEKSDGKNCWYPPGKDIILTGYPSGDEEGDEDTLKEKIERRNSIEPPVNVEIVEVDD